MKNKSGETSIRLVLYTSGRVIEGEYPLMLCITKDRHRSYIWLGFRAKPEQWNEAKKCLRKNHPQKDLIEEIVRQKTTACQNIIRNLTLQEKVFTSNTLKALLEGNYKKTPTTLQAFIKEIIERRKAEGRLKYAARFEDTLRVIKHFRKTDIPLSDIDINFCNKFETFLRECKLKETSISIYFRDIRKVLNDAIAEKLIKGDTYPFKEYKISKFNTSTVKRAIGIADIKAISELPLVDGSRQFRSRHIFLFSFYLRGINFNDIAKLTWKNLQGDRLTYIRSKTGQHFSIKLVSQAQIILDYYRNLTFGTSTDYIFPLLDRIKHNTPKTILNRIEKTLRQTNTDLKAIGKIAGLSQPLTTYTARHSYATGLKLKGVSIAVISEAMGHATEAITHTYLKSFENEVLDQADEELFS